MSYHVEYYNRRVLREIESWPADLLADYARLIELLLEHGPDLRLPYSRSLGRGLFELRAKGREGIGRTFNCFLAGKRIVVLHGFVKKTQQTPNHDLQLARQRAAEVAHGQ